MTLNKIFQQDTHDFYETTRATWRLQVGLQIMITLKEKQKRKRLYINIFTGKQNPHFVSLIVKRCPASMFFHM